MNNYKNKNELPEKEAEKIKKYLEESGYEARLKSLEESLADILSRLNTDKGES